MKDEEIEFLSVSITSVWSSKMIVADPKGNVEDLSSMGMSISWAAKGMGFGQVELKQRADGSYEWDTEYMGKEFVLALFKYMLDNGKHR